MIAIASPTLGTAESTAVRSVLESGQLADGPEVRKFEREFATHSNAEFGVATANGTAALHTALHALGIGEGDRVVTTPFSFVATANAIRHSGAEPVFADIDPETLTLDPAAVAAVAERIPIDAILAVHLYGLPAAMDRLRAVADRYGAALVEDAAQAHGARYRGEPVGSLGDAAAFSFYPSKNMTTGEGGMVTTDRADVADRAARFVDHGRGETRYEHVTVGYNYRMTSVGAAIGRVQLDRLPDLVETRRANARTLAAAVADTDLRPQATVPHATHAYNQFTVRTTERDRLRDVLAAVDVGTAVYYPLPIHRQPPYAAGGHGSFPVAERAAETVLSIPVHPNLTPGDLETIAVHLGRAADE